jgi:hypothetical protein
MIKNGGSLIRRDFMWQVEKEEPVVSPFVVNLYSTTFFEFQQYTELPFVPMAPRMLHCTSVSMVL